MFDNKSLPHVIRHLATNLRTAISSRVATGVVTELDTSFQSQVNLALLHQCGVEVRALAFSPLPKDLTGDLLKRFKFTLVEIPETPLAYAPSDDMAEVIKLGWLDKQATEENMLVAHSIVKDDFDWVYMINQRMMHVDLMPLVGFYFEEVLQLAKFLGVASNEAKSPTLLTYKELKHCNEIFSANPYNIEACTEAAGKELKDAMETYVMLALKNKFKALQRPLVFEMDDFRG